MSTYESHPSPIDAQRILNDDRDGYTVQVTWARTSPIGA